MPPKKQSAFKRFIRSIDDAPSPYEQLIWAFLAVAYFLWAALAPVFPHSKSCEPWAALLSLGLFLAFYFFNLPHRLYFLVLFSVISFIAIPSILILNIYRAVRGLFPATWSQADFWNGAVVFIGIQILGLLLMAGHINYTFKRWKKADTSEKQELKRQSKLLLLLVIFFLVPVLFFVFAGPIRRAFW